MGLTNSMIFPNEINGMFYYFRKEGDDQVFYRKNPMTGIEVKCLYIIFFLLLF